MERVLSRTVPARVLYAALIKHKSLPLSLCTLLLVPKLSTGTVWRNYAKICSTPSNETVPSDSQCALLAAHYTLSKSTFNALTYL